MHTKCFLQAEACNLPPARHASFHAYYMSTIMRATHLLVQQHTSQLARFWHEIRSNAVLSQIMTKASRTDRPAYLDVYWSPCFFKTCCIGCTFLYRAQKWKLKYYHLHKATPPRVSSLLQAGWLSSTMRTKNRPRTIRESEPCKVVDELLFSQGYEVSSLLKFTGDWTLPAQYLGGS